jgi:ADP-dependent NAD(P)H-hydrate dehydratase / NAD(P)H-hydrate epimerase
MSNLFYSAQQVRCGESVAAKAKGLEMFGLMERAGQAVFAIGMAQYPAANHWLVCCGQGNNGGDGYIVASLAKSVGIYVTVWQHGNPEQLKGDAQVAYQHWLSHGGVTFPVADELPEEVDVIIDALLGTGLKGEVRDATWQVIQRLNQFDKPIISVDIPSGLCADTGNVLGIAIHADHTVSFIGLKQGLITGRARDYVGMLHYAGLGIEETFNQQNKATVTAIDPKSLSKLLPKRRACAHKGNHGRALLVGGNIGMGGAVILAAMACAKSGVGLAAVMSHANNVTPLLVSIPEVMSCDWENERLLLERVDWCDVIAIGPGLGRDSKAQRLLSLAQSSPKPKVVDADALYFLGLEPNIDSQRIITPHPGEASHLLNMPIESIEKNRFSAVQALQAKFGGVVVLKGAGTLVCDGQDTYVCLAGNPGMASGGMGDVLSGIIASLLAQGLNVSEAARMGVLIHSMAADKSALEHGERGLLASDLLHYIRRLVN